MFLALMIANLLPFVEVERVNMIYIEMLGINVVDLLLMVLVVFARKLIKTWLLWDLIHGSPIRFKPSLASIACL